MSRMTDKRFKEVIRWYSKEDIPMGELPPTPTDEEIVDASGKEGPRRDCMLTDLKESPE